MVRKLARVPSTGPTMCPPESTLLLMVMLPPIVAFTSDPEAMSAPLAPAVARAVLMMMLLLTVMPLSNSTRALLDAPGSMNNVALPSALLWAIYRSAPALPPPDVLTTTWPLIVLFPARTSAPPPFLMNPLVPAIDALMVTLRVLKVLLFGLTVMTG